MENYYTILGLTKDANIDEIKKKYRELAMLHHPDKGGSEDLFKKIAGAYEVLSDSKKKIEYDRTNFKSSSSSSSSNTSNKKTKWSSYWESPDFYSKYSDFDYYTKESYTPPPPLEENDIYVQHTISLKDILSNSSGNFTFGRKNICKCKESTSSMCMACKGKGKIDSKIDCILCNGKGKIDSTTCSVCDGKKEVYETITTFTSISSFRHILIKGSSYKVTIPDMGHQSKKDPSKRGRLFLTLYYRPEHNFSISGDDVIYQNKVELDLLMKNDGMTFYYATEDITMDATTILENLGMPIRIKGKGLIDSNLFSRGDLVLLINVDMNISFLLKNERIRQVILEEYIKNK